MRSFPTGAGYVDALHHPDTCLTDPRLSGARVELTNGGWPRPRSGAAASVFRLDAVDGARYALKCFTRASQDQHQRYATIAGHLADQRSGWQITFEYQEEGILVEGGSWPILVMEWVDDATDLARSVSTLLHRPARLGRLATRFAGVCADLARRRIAHGDLQHGNVLATGNGAIRLIDYDGMWVPDLADRPGIEFGQPNFQHPARRQEHAGPALDHFSSWVIYVSLLATATDTDLWHQLRGGDECLLFRAADFADPGGSAAFAALSTSDWPVIREAAAQLAEFAGCADPAEVPPLDAAAFPVPRLPARRRSAAQRVAWTGEGVAGWRTAGWRASTPDPAGQGGTSGAPGGRPGVRFGWPAGARRQPGGAGGAGRRPAATAGWRGARSGKTGRWWRRRAPTASVWSSQPRLLRTVRSWALLRRGRFRPGGPSARAEPANARWLGAVAALVGVGICLGWVFDDGDTRQQLGVPPGYSLPGAEQSAYAGGLRDGYPLSAGCVRVTDVGCGPAGAATDAYLRCLAQRAFDRSLASLLPPPPLVSLGPALKEAAKPKQKPKPKPTRKPRAATPSPTAAVPSPTPTDPCLLQSPVLAVPTGTP